MALIRLTAADFVIGLTSPLGSCQENMGSLALAGTTRVRFCSASSGQGKHLVFRRVWLFLLRVGLAVRKQRSCCPGQTGYHSGSGAVGD